MLPNTRYDNELLRAVSCVSAVIAKHTVSTTAGGKAGSMLLQRVPGEPGMDSRCFWLEKNRKVKRPRGIFPSLPGGMDRVIKMYCDGYCKDGRKGGAR